MSWNTSLLSGPWQVPIYGADGATITGYQPGIVFVLPTSEVTPDLTAYAGDVPPGVPLLAGVPSSALTFTSEDAAKIVLAIYWIGASQ